MTKQRLLILGGGFAGYQLACDIATKFYEVTIVSTQNHFVFTPLLASSAVGTVQFRSIVEPLHQLATRAQFLKAEAKSIDLDKHQVSCLDSERRSCLIPYDILVIAVGTTSRTYDIPGVSENCLMLKELSHARLIRQKLITQFEKASMPGLTEMQRRNLLHFVVVGGGPTGVEFAGELHDFIKEDAIRLFPTVQALARISLLDAGPRILNNFDEHLSCYTQRIFLRRGIEVKTQTLVEYVLPNEIALKNGEKIPYGMAVWSAGVEQLELVKNLSLEKDASGRIVVEKDLSIPAFPDSYAIGDCAIIRGYPLPQTAQVAMQQAKYLAKSLKRRALSKLIKPFHYWHMGMLTYIGGQRAIADTPGINLRGVIAWLMWRGVYLTKLVSLRNKMRVFTDWLYSAIFGRDSSVF